MCVGGWEGGRVGGWEGGGRVGGWVGGWAGMHVRAQHYLVSFLPSPSPRMSIHLPRACNLERFAVDRDRSMNGLGLRAPAGGDLRHESPFNRFPDTRNPVPSYSDRGPSFGNPQPRKAHCRV